MGSKKKLELDDIYRVLPCDSSGNLGNDLAQRWEKELRYCYEKNILQRPLEHRLTPSLGKILVQQFQKSYILLGLLACIEECFIRYTYDPILEYLNKIRFFQFPELYFSKLIMIGSPNQSVLGI